MEEFKLTEESNVVEYKKELPIDHKKWLKTIVSFSNTIGGKLIIGVEDSSLKIIGINEERSKIEQKISEAIFNGIEPKPVVDIVFKNIDQKDIIIVHVGKGNETPYYIKSEGMDNGTYIRYGSTNHQATQHQLYELKLNRMNEYFSNKVYLNNDNQTKINENEIDELLDQLNKRRKSSQIINKNKLKDWKLIRDNFDNEYVTNGLMLLLSNPFHYAHIRIGVFEGENKTKLKKDMICEGSIIDQFDEVIEKLLIELEDGYEIRITRDKKYKIPEVAIREILANAIIHRSYVDEHPIRISVFKNRVEFYSPGTLFDGMQQESLLNGISRLRNPNISEVFYQIGIIEKWGSGISRANDSLKEARLNPLDINVDLHGITVTIFFENNNEYIQENTLPLENENYLKYKTEFTRKDIERDLNYTQDRARDLIEKWMKEGLITIIKKGPQTKYITNK